MEKELIKGNVPNRSDESRPRKYSRKRLEVLKTYKIYIGGQFPRSESGRYYLASNNNGDRLANVCLSSRKDFKDAVVAARAALRNWSGKTAFNRGQILYRIAEILEGRKAQFTEELIRQDSKRSAAQREVTSSVDRLVYYAGWCDKYQQIFSTVNPVASSHFNFSVPEPTGVVSIIAPQESPLIGMVSTLAPVIAGGNTCVVLASETKPLCAVDLAEVINSSDVPAGTVNILTGRPAELFAQFGSHMDVNAVICCVDDDIMQKEIRQKAAGNVKRVLDYKGVNWMSGKGQSPYYILDTQEIKTTWHPIENSGTAAGGY